MEDLGIGEKILK